LHTIFFHRFFPSITPLSREVLDITLPFVDDQELDTMIEKRTAELDRELSAERTHAPHSAGGGAAGGGGRGNVSVQFFEKKRRKTWYMRAAYGGGDEEICWESWTVKVTVAEPRTESGKLAEQTCVRRFCTDANNMVPERAKVRKAMEQTLLTTVMKIITYVNQNKDHIPPITTSESNPFPYQINVNQKDAGWAKRIGIY
jgi:autophagy-related protein 101